MKIRPIHLCALVLLSGCSEAPADEEILPGMWKISLGMTAIEVPDATPEQAELIGSLVGDLSSHEQCIGEGEGKFDPSEMAQALAQGNDCEPSSFTVSEGELSGSLMCTLPDTRTSEFAVRGQVQPENFSMIVTMEMTQASLPAGKANVTVEMTGERLGDC